MHGLVGCVVEVGHWRDSEGVGEPPKWVAEYEARVVAVLQPTSDEWRDAPQLLVVKLATGELRAVNIDHVIVPEFRHKRWTREVKEGEINDADVQSVS